MYIKDLFWTDYLRIVAKQNWCRFVHEEQRRMKGIDRKREKEREKKGNGYHYPLICCRPESAETKQATFRNWREFRLEKYINKMSSLIDCDCAYSEGFG